jgi:hypothetical protein
VIIDGQVHGVPADAAVAVLRAVARDAVAHAAEPRMRPSRLVSMCSNSRGRPAHTDAPARAAAARQRGQARQAQALHAPADGGQAATTFTCNAPQREAFTAALLDPQASIEHAYGCSSVSPRLSCWAW